jgi:L-iditol 2-dehydrogenase
MKQLICSAHGRVEIVDTEVPSLKSGELLVRLRACGICGTDLMKVYDHNFTKPVQLGHEFVGIITRTGRDVARFRPGERVALGHHVPDYSSHFSRRGSEPMDSQFKRSNIVPGGFAEFVRIPERQVAHTVVNVPDSVPDQRAVFMEPIACCLRALDRVKVVEGDTLLIIGVGSIGLLFVPLGRDRSTTVVVADLQAERLKLASTWGASAGFLADREDVASGCRQYTAGRGVDLAILTIVNQQTLSTALDCVRDGGTVLLFGTKPDQELKLNAWQFWRREINLISSYSATPDLLPRAMAILNRSDYPLEDTVSHIVPLAEGPTAFELAYRGQASKVVIVP